MHANHALYVIVPVGTSTELVAYHYVVSTVLSRSNIRRFRF
jgi:hypothetical protein